MEQHVATEKLELRQCQLTLLCFHMKGCWNNAQPHGYTSLQALVTLHSCCYTLFVNYFNRCHLL